MATSVYDPLRRFHLTLSREGEEAVVQARVEPGGGVPTHLHPHQTERFSVQKGTVSFRVGRKRIDAGPGEEVIVEPATRHSFRNASDSEVIFTARLDPAMDAEGFFLDSAALANSGLVTRSGLPKRPRALLRGAQLLRRYREDVVLSVPPPALQRLFLPLILRFSGGGEATPSGGSGATR